MKVTAKEVIAAYDEEMVEMLIQHGEAGLIDDVKRELLSLDVESLPPDKAEKLWHAIQVTFDNLYETAREDPEKKEDWLQKYDQLDEEIRGVTEALNKRRKIAQMGAGKMTIRQLKDMLNTMKDDQQVAIQFENNTLYAVKSIDVSQTAAGPMVVIETGIVLGTAGPESGGGGGTF